MLKVGANVGPFTVGPVIGRGGIATVYEAQHAIDAHPVALKVLRSDIAFDADFSAAFAEEVRSAARLDHPRITAVYDYGIISESVSDDQPGSDTSWLAMELVRGGTISKLAGKATWPTIRGIVLDVLDALAHSHARGFIHRDIKPANVLMDPHSGRIKLTDFGLAQSVDMYSSHDEFGGVFFDENHVTGTPSYMAPEQITNDWRSFGPWTDLYAVGVLAWTLATGKPPYDGSINEILEQHLDGVLPAFSPHSSMPTALFDWISTMMAVQPYNRFARAADAAWTLSDLQPPTEPTGAVEDSAKLRINADAPTVSIRKSEPLDTLILNTQKTGRLHRNIEPLLLPDDKGLPPSPVLTDDVASGLSNVHPPFPTNWSEKRRRRVHIHRAGLALFGLRATGVVGREKERDRIWASMKEVIEQQRTKVVLLEGASGSGKSTLAKWFCQRVDELGVGQFRISMHSREGGPNDGIGSMLRQSLRIAGLDRDSAIEHASVRLQRLGLTSHEDAVGLVEFAGVFSDDGEDKGLGAVSAGQDEAFASITRFLHAIARSRPLVLWLDEIHHSTESQALVQCLMTHEIQGPICILATVSAEDVTAGSEAERQLKALMGSGHSEKISLPPLRATEQVKLMSELLGLEPSLASDVASKCGGNPQFAVQIVGDWVERGILVPGDDGFTLKKGCDASIPSTLFAAWQARLDDLIAQHNEQALWALEIGAVLGNNVDRVEWDNALQKASIEPPDALIAELLRLRLIVRADAISNWSFVHALFRETVLKHAKDGGRMAEWSSICADSIVNQRADWTRWARLLVAGGRGKEALEPLHQAIFHEMLAEEDGRAKNLYNLREQIIQSMNVQPGGRLDFTRQLCLFWLEANTEEVSALGPLRDRGLVLLDWAIQLEDWPSTAALYRKVGAIHTDLGNFQQSEKYLIEAFKVAKKHRLDIMVKILVSLCFLHQRAGDLDRAFQYARDCLFTAERQGSVYNIAEAYVFMARVKRQAGDLESARFYLDAAIIRHERLGARLPLAACWNTRGDIARTQGDVELAIHAYGVSADLFEATGNPAVHARMNLCTTWVETGKFDETERQLTELEAQNDLRDVHCMLVLLQVACRAHAQDWPAVESGLAMIRSELDAMGLVDLDIATTARMIGEYSAAADQSELALTAWTIAFDQFKALGREEDSGAIKERLDELGTNVPIS